MLQQTIASVVIPYYERWMKHFPTVESLAQAPEDLVLKLWEGLGYYSRARNLQKAAKMVVEKHGGSFPCEPELLKELPGIGPYTLGAVRSFAFKQKAPAIDGNVIRVITRLFGIVDPIEKTQTKQRIHQAAESLLSDDQPWIETEALIELGALVCKKRALCEECPLQEACVAKNQGLVEKLPNKKRPQKTVRLTRLVAIIRRGDQLLLSKESERKVMQGLHQFPFLEVDEKIHSPKEAFEKELGLSLSLKENFEEVTHTFTKYHVTLLPFYFETEQNSVSKGLFWKTKEEIEKLSFSSGHRKVLKQYADFTT